MPRHPKAFADRSLQVSLSLTPALVERIDHAANGAGISRSEAVRRALTLYLPMLELARDVRLETSHARP